ncbi:GTPase IMAP family member 6-like, partial [Chanos chanos]|uniref:GTPase IMAP family member 6-like n=1 Tax=Chanos chanos TaxID=29144 RepID=A0A6J2V1K4_CHACN
MEIRWFKRTECFYQYKNGERTDGGEYRCEVICGEGQRSALQAHLQVYVGGESPSLNLPVSPELRLVLLGLSETVKWAAGNTILGREEFGIQAATSTETQHSESRQGEVAGRQLVVVDTPDWLSPGLSQEEMRKDVGLCVHLSAPGPHTFLLVCPLEPSDGEDSRLLERMEDIFGESFWGHTMILFINAEGIVGKNLEDLLKARSQALQQLLDKSRNRCHLLNINDMAKGTEVRKLLEKIEEMMSKNREKFYSSETYLIAENHLKEIERKIQKEREERRERQEREIREKLERELQDSLKQMEGELQEKEEKIVVLEKRINDLEIELENERNEERRKELEMKLKEESEYRKEIEKEQERLREEMEREKREKEEKHRRELEEIRENYEMEAKAEAERNLMKIILPELHSSLSISATKMRNEFNRQLEQRDGEIKR